MAFFGEAQKTAPAIIHITGDGDEAIALERLQRGRERRAVHGKQLRDLSDRRRLGAIESIEQRELAAVQANRPQRLVELPRQRASGALNVQA